MRKSKAIFLLLRLPFLVVTLGSVFVGTAFAWWNTEQFDLVLFFLTLIGACCFHIACNVANDYFDYKSGTDAANVYAVAPFSGGSRMVLDGFVKPGEALAISFGFAVLGSAIGLYLNAVSTGNVILIIGVAALLLVYGYNGPPLKLVNLGIGEIGIFLAWGPLMVLGAYYVQAQSFSSFWPLIAALPPGILTTLVLVINEFADAEADRTAGRKTWTILFGFKKTLYIYLALALGCYVVILAGIFLGGWPLWSLLVLVTLPLLLMAFQIAIKNIGNWTDFLPAVKTTILINFVFLVILSVTLII